MIDARSWNCPNFTPHASSSARIRSPIQQIWYASPVLAKSPRPRYASRIPIAEQDAIDFIAACRPDFDLGRSARFAIALRDTGEFCGGIGLRIMPAHHRAELGYWLGVPYWGKGYATEASQEVLRFGFETLKLRRIYASYVTENLASGRVLEKIGMRSEGMLRSHICKWDVFHDLVYCGILDDEFRARPVVAEAREDDQPYNSLSSS